MQLFRGDCLVELDKVENESINLCFVDPPYNIGVFCKMPPAEYLAWCEQWIALCSRKLAANGAFWVSHKNLRILGQLANMIEVHGRGLINWITWDKYNDAEDLQGFMDGYTVMGDLRSFQVMAEYLIYHADEGQWTAQCDKERGFIFEPLRAYLAEEWKRAGLTAKNAAECLGVTKTMVSQHYFSNSQWGLPTQLVYEKLQMRANKTGDNEYLYREYEDLRREYEDLRQEYESLRYTFNNPGLVSSVWQIPPAKRNGHLTPKPIALMQRIIETTSNPGDVVLDPMMGSGTTLAVAARLKRRGIGCEINPRYFEQAKRRIEQAQAEMVQLTMPESIVQSTVGSLV